MPADIFGVPAEVATIVGVFVVVGGVAASRTKRFRTDRRNRATVHDVVVGIPAVVIDGIVIEAAKPGLVSRVANIETHLVEMDERLMPNGLNTNNPGDVIGRTEAKVDKLGELVERVITHLDLDADG